MQLHVLGLLAARPPRRPSFLSLGLLHDRLGQVVTRTRAVSVRPRAGAPAITQLWCLDGADLWYRWGAPGARPAAAAAWCADGGRHRMRMLGELLTVDPNRRPTLLSRQEHSHGCRLCSCHIRSGGRLCGSSASASLNSSQSVSRITSQKCYI